MRFNFYISCENDQEARDCIDFIAEMTAKRDTAQSFSERHGTTPEGSAAVQPVSSGRSTERPNLDPGKPSITKIGGSTRDEILTRVRDNLQPNPKFTEHCKLLWSRGEIKFDGKEWYL